MIHGIGIDLVHVGRFKAAMERRGQRFLKKLFTENELSYCMRQRNPETHLAARFAAKVSLFKAVGRWRSFTDVEITRAAGGRPIVAAKGVSGLRFSLSISHDGDLSVAEIIAEEVEE